MSVFNTLDHLRDLLACACVCKAWRTGKAKALLPRLNLERDDFALLLQLSPLQMAAVREVFMCFFGDPEYATASVMLLSFVCGRLPMLQRLMLDCGDPFQRKDDFAEVRVALVIPAISVRLIKACFLRSADDLAQEGL